MSDRLVEHPARVARLENGVLVPRHRQSDDELTVWAPASLIYEYEGLLAKQINEGSGEILSIPFFRTGICLGDVVTIVHDHDTGSMVVGPVLRQSKFANYIVRLARGDDSSGHPAWHRLMTALEDTGCWFDPMNAEQVGVAVPIAMIEPVSTTLRRVTAEGLAVQWGRFDKPSDQFLAAIEPLFLPLPNRALDEQ